MLSDSSANSTRIHIPKAYGAIRASYDDYCAIWRIRHAMNRIGAISDGTADYSCLSIPNDDGLIQACGNDMSAFRRVSNAFNPPAMTAHGALQCSRFRIPKSNLAIIATRSKFLTIWSKGKTPNRAGMTLQGL